MKGYVLILLSCISIFLLGIYTGHCEKNVESPFQWITTGIFALFFMIYGIIGIKERI